MRVLSSLVILVLALVAGVWAECGELDLDGGQWGIEAYSKPNCKGKRITSVYKKKSTKCVTLKAPARSFKSGTKHAQHWDGYTKCDMSFWTTLDCDKQVKGLSPSFTMGKDGTYDDGFSYFVTPSYQLWIDKLEPGDHETDETIKSYRVKCWRD
jgi:hypothetical protein